MGQDRTLGASLGKGLDHGSEDLAGLGIVLLAQGQLDGGCHHGGQQRRITLGQGDVLGESHVFSRQVRLASGGLEASQVQCDAAVDRGQVGLSLGLAEGLLVELLGAILIPHDLQGLAVHQSCLGLERRVVAFVRDFQGVLAIGPGSLVVVRHPGQALCLLHAGLHRLGSGPWV